MGKGREIPLEIQENARLLIHYIERTNPKDQKSRDLVYETAKTATDETDFWSRLCELDNEYLMNYNKYPLPPNVQIPLMPTVVVNQPIPTINNQKQQHLVKVTQKPELTESDFQVVNKPQQQPKEQPSKPSVVNVTNHELPIINFENLKNRLEKKIDNIRKHKIKDFRCDIHGCWEVLENGFQIYIRNLLDSLIKISAYESNLETLGDFQVNDETLPPHLRIFEEDENKKSLLRKIEDKTAKEKNRIEIINGENWLEKFKAISKMEEQDQKEMEDLLQNKPFLDVNSDKTSKKMKKGNEECNEFCKLLLKSKNEKDKELDQKKQSEEATQITLDKMTEKSKSSKLSKKFPEETIVQQKTTKDTKFSQSQKPMPVRQRITLKTLIFYLENNSLYRKSSILQTAYQKQN